MTSSFWMDDMIRFNNAYLRMKGVSDNKLLMNYQDNDYDEEDEEDDGEEYFSILDVINPEIFKSFLVLYDNDKALYDIYKDCISAKGTSHGRAFMSLFTNSKKCSSIKVRYDECHPIELQHQWLNNEAHRSSIDKITKCLTEFKIELREDLKEKLNPYDNLLTIIEILSNFDPDSDSDSKFDIKKIIDIFDITEKDLRQKIIPYAIEQVFGKPDKINICLLKNVYYNFCESEHSKQFLCISINNCINEMLSDYSDTVISTVKSTDEVDDKLLDDKSYENKKSVSVTNSVDSVEDDDNDDSVTNAVDSVEDDDNDDSVINAINSVTNAVDSVEDDVNFKPYIKKICFGNTLEELIFVSKVFDLAEFAAWKPRNIYYSNIDIVCYFYITTKSVLGKDFKIKEVYFGVKNDQKNSKLAEKIRAIYYE